MRPWRSVPLLNALFYLKAALLVPPHGSALPALAFGIGIPYEAHERIDLKTQRNCRVRRFAQAHFQVNILHPLERRDAFLVGAPIRFQKNILLRRGSNAAIDVREGMLANLLVNLIVQSLDVLLDVRVRSVERSIVSQYVVREYSGASPVL